MSGLKSKTSDVHKFIAKIKSTPVIWNYKQSAATPIADRQLAWEKIVLEMEGPKYHELTEEQKQDEIDRYKGRWKGLRDGYSKMKKKKKRYMYDKLLSFLDGNNGTRRGILVRSNLSNDSAQCKTTDKNDPIKFEFMDMDMSNEQAEQVYKTEENVIGNGLDSTLSSVSAASPAEGMDPEKAYLLSLLPDFKRLSAVEKVDFRIYTLKFFKEHYRNKS